MAFDPLQSPHYKVICVRKMAHQPSNYTLDVYSSETDSWSLSRISFPVNNPIPFEDNVLFCNGKIHWYSFWNDLLYFDVENESLDSLPIPELTMEEPHHECIYMGECRGVLYISLVYYFFGCSKIDVFEMANDYSHWSLKHRLSIGNIHKDFPDISWDIHPDSQYFGSPLFSDVCITQLEKDDEPKIVIWIENKVIFFHFNDETRKSLYDLRPGFTALPCDVFVNGNFVLPYQIRHGYPYFENLSCV